MEHNKSIDFLDFTISKDESNILQSTIYHKPLSQNTLLRAVISNHPPYLVCNIPVSSTTTDFN